MSDSFLCRPIGACCIHEQPRAILPGTGTYLPQLQCTVPAIFYVIPRVSTVRKQCTVVRPGTQGTGTMYCDCTSFLFDSVFDRVGLVFQ
jgi:hypothetical protein